MVASCKLFLLNVRPSGGLLRPTPQWPPASRRRLRSAPRQIYAPLRSWAYRQSDSREGRRGRHRGCSRRSNSSRPPECDLQKQKSTKCVKREGHTTREESEIFKK